MKWQHKVRSKSKARLPSVANIAVWEKVTKGRAGRRRDSVVEKVWTDVGGNQEDILSMEKFAGYMTQVK